MHHFRANKRLGLAFSFKEYPDGIDWMKVTTHISLVAYSPRTTAGPRKSQKVEGSSTSSQELESGQFSSVQSLSCVQLCNPMNHSTSGHPVHHQLLEFTQTHVHWVGDAIQPSHPLLSPSPPVPNPSQHQGLFKWVSSLHQVAKLLEFQLQHGSFQ